MIRGFYTASSGLKWQQASLDVAANNIANINTVGYKPQQLEFMEALSSSLASAGEDVQKLVAGSGVKGAETAKSFAQGTLETTGRNLDVAIEGNGFFATADRNGQISYTRAGNFSASTVDDQNYLVSASGDFVLSQSGEPVTFEGQPEDLVLGGPGGGDAEGTAVSLGVFKFSNPYALEQGGEDKYRANAASGVAEDADDATIKQGYLETSAVDMAAEFTRVIQAQRAFQFNAKMIQVADEIEQMTNTLRG